MAERKGKDFIPSGMKRELSFAIPFVLSTVLLVVKCEGPVGPLPVLQVLAALLVSINNPCLLLGFQQGQVSTLRRVPVDRQQCCNITESWVDLEKLSFFGLLHFQTRVISMYLCTVCTCVHVLLYMQRSTRSTSSSHLGLPLVHMSQPCTQLLPLNPRHYTDLPQRVMEVQSPTGTTHLHAR